ncbi:thiamine transporter 2 [Harpegnathos saltator]|uniref:Thiamine transporter 2 n=1 Tax=Harpegnathos saltator TaxID=610380 RepID=E2BJ57_HARSA|nr:thiamine transporter 2 [Harpegnathos saltator]XP_011139818.1 thiamine transporter 2 [Harpegnathos saltator]EFN84207.1 Thiamine transporter 2 [Harpegnathos saltator]
MHWIRISCILCMFGCFKDFRPSESFVTNYLMGPWKNFTSSEVNQDIYPVSTYCYAAMLIFVFLITDFVRYKPIIILCGLSGVTTFVMIVLGQTVLVMQIMEFFYGLFLSAEVAYYTYIYAKVDKKHYQEVTGHTKAASLFGRSMSGVVAQLTASFNILDYHQLNYVTIAAFSTATIWALFLPSVGQSIYFHRASTCDEENSIGEQEKKEVAQSRQRSSRWLCCIGSNRDSAFGPQYQSSLCNKSCFCGVESSGKLQFRDITRAYALLWKHFVQAYADHRVLKWSLWWALGTCGYLQVANYMQLLWLDTVHSNDEIYNGAVDFAYAILGAITVFSVGKIRLNWDLLGDISLSMFSFLCGAIMVVSSYSYNIWFLYAGYIIFGVIYHTMVTVASFEVAKYICEDSYGLIFGINIFIALVAQSLFTLVVVNALMLNIRWQYFIYGSYFVILGFMYFLMGILNIVKYYQSNERFNLWTSDETQSTVTQTTNDMRDNGASAAVEENGN